MIAEALSRRQQTAAAALMQVHARPADTLHLLLDKDLVRREDRCIAQGSWVDRCDVEYVSMLCSCECHGCSLPSRKVVLMCQAVQRDGDDGYTAGDEAR